MIQVYYEIERLEKNGWSLARPRVPQEDVDEVIRSMLTDNPHLKLRKVKVTREYSQVLNG